MTSLDLYAQFRELGTNLGWMEFSQPWDSVDEDIQVRLIGWREFGRRY